MNQKILKYISAVAFYATIALMLFLPFSSWLVSLTGQSSIALVRDGLVFILLIAALFLTPIKKVFLGDKITILAWAFIAWGILTVFWGDASLAQWLKGFRFTYMPIIMFLAIRNLAFHPKQKRVIFKLIMTIGVIIGLVALCELFGLKVPLTTALSGTNGLDSSHFVGETIIQRLQAILAGPNALGLYMLAVFALILTEYKFRREWYIGLVFMLIGGVLFFTYSRSALAGLALMVLIAMVIALREKMSQYIAFGLAVLIIGTVGVGGYFLTKQPAVEVFVSHSTSSSLRVEQLQRIWDTKYEIGLFGRGLGNAGPASQSRLDNGPNHWTENIYLDIFEDTGLIGLLLYLATMTLLVISTVRKSYTPKSATYQYNALILGVSFAIIGLFINYYTGQVGIFILWLIYAFSAGPAQPLTLRRRKKKRIVRLG